LRALPAATAPTADGVIESVRGAVDPAILFGPAYPEARAARLGGRREARRDCSATPEPRYTPRQTGARLDRNASIPSRKSALM